MASEAHLGALLESALERRGGTATLVYEGRTHRCRAFVENAFSIPSPRTARAPPASSFP
jgi:hypothetical protein